MKALFISNDPAVFAPESATRARMREYARALEELHVVSVAPSGARAEQEGQLFLHPVGRGLFRTLRMTRAARRIVRERKIDVVSAQDPFEHAQIANDAVVRTKAALHLQVHTDLASPEFARSSWKNRARLAFADRYLPKADGIRTVSRRVRDSLVARYGEKIVEPSIIPIAPAPASPPLSPLPSAPFTFSLFMAARLEPEKRIEDALQALALLRRKYPGTGLFIAGDGRERAALGRRVRALGLADAVVFLGARADVPGLMKSAHALIQTSAYEGYGRTLIEAALARLPIVSTETGLVGDVLVPERELLSCPVGDVACLAGQVGRLVEDNQLRRALAVNAEAAALAHLAHFQNLPKLIAEDLAARPAQVKNPRATR